MRAPEADAGLREAAGAWLLDPDVDLLNHGAFGACPRPVLAEQQRLRDEMERRPVEFLDRRVEQLLAQARTEIAAFVRADPEGLVFVPNATTAAATVLAHVGLRAGERLVITDHAYPALHNAARLACEAAGAELHVVEIGLPFPGDVVDRVAAAIDDRTRLVAIDHIASFSGAIFPVEQLVAGCRSRGVTVYVDAAHAPGQVPVDVDALAPDYWGANLHKWVCAPKGSGVMWVAPEHRGIRPVVASHAHLETLHARFDWNGTYDPTALLAAPAAIRFLGALGWDAVMAHNDALAGYGRAVVADAIGSEQLVPAHAFAAMAVVGLPDGVATTREEARSMQAHLFAQTRIEVPFVPWNGRGYLRLSAQIYNRPEQYERLAEALPKLL